MHFLAIPLLVLMLVVPGCNKGTSSPAPAAPRVAYTASPEVNSWIVMLFRAHGLDAREDGAWVTFPGCPVKINGEIQSKQPGGNEHVVQVDFRTLLPNGRVVVEQLAGVGETKEAAAKQAFGSFVIGSFHVLLSAFVDPGDEHIQPEEWTVSGRPRVATVGDLLVKSGKSEKVDTNGPRHDELIKIIQSSPIPPGTHWVDVYHASLTKEEITEVQLDNERWTSVENRLRDVRWPSNGKFVSVRQLIVIQDPKDPTRPTTRPTTIPAELPRRAATEPAAHR